MFDTPVASKYFLTTTPPAPAKCIGCNNDAKGSNIFIDTTSSLDYYGAVLICEDCIREMSSLIGFINVEKLNESIELSNELTQQLQIEREKVEKLENVILAYRTVESFASGTDSNNSSNSDKESSSTDKGSGDSVPEKTESGLFK